MNNFEKTSLRYVKKVSDNLESSHNKILKRIKNGTRVLEIGPASGAMTKVLKEQLKCRVSIIEYDSDCYKKVMEYADDGIEANVENEDWKKFFAGQLFDYIIFADVLEHLLYPQKVLKEMQSFLTDEGSVFISVPNMAHNSIIIQLLNNHLMYQNTGLLDYSHVRFYTYSEVERLYKESGYGAVYLDATYVGVGKNEFDIQYSDTDPLISECLKKRPLGEVYQYLAELKKQSYVDNHQIIVENCLGDPIVYEDSKTIYCKESEGNLPNGLYATNTEIARLRLEINDLYNTIPEIGNTLTLRRMIEQMQSEVHEKNIHIRNLIQEIEQKDEQIGNQQVQIEQKDEQISNQQVQIGQKDEQLIKIQNDLKDMYTQEQVDDLKQIIRNKEGHIELLLESERAYERDKNTLSYRIMAKGRKVWDFFLPPFSKRRFFVEVLAKVIRHPKLMFHVINPTRIKNFFVVLKSHGMKGVFEWYNNALEIEQNNLNPASNLQINGQLAGNTEGTEESKKVLTIEQFDNLVFTEWKQPLVSIIIPVYNQFEYTYNCLKSIMLNSGDVKYEIFIANDCSTDCTKDIEKIAKNVRLVTTAKNVRFLLNCNNAAKYARGKYILFLNNDTQVQENWLQPLVDLIERDDSIGMVGSKLIYPDGKLQEAGGILWKDASAWNYGNRQDADAPEFNYVKEVDYISGAAIMIKKSLWDEIGGFDEHFAPAYCEDSDLAFEVRKHGYKVMYQPKSVVVHFEGVSNGTDVSSGLKSYQVENGKKFFEKWKDTLEKEHFENGTNVFTARDKSANKPCLLMVDHYVPQYDKDAGSRTVYAYLKLFVKMGFNVKFIGDNFHRHEPYTTSLQQLGIEVLYGPEYANNWKTWIQTNAKEFKYVFLNRPHISVNYIDFIRQETKAKIIYYGHDLHFLREFRQYQLTKKADTLKSSEEWKKKELSLMHKADVVYYPSEVEVQEISKIDSKIDAKAIVAYIFPEIQRRKYDFSKKNDLLFVGGFTHTPNVDAVLWFCNEILPIIVERIPDIKLYIVGSNAPEKVLNLSSENVIIKGFVSDEELNHLYEKCKLAVIPLRYGAGIKGKVIEAMSNGVPIVTTSVGAEGIIGAEKFMCIEDGKEAFAYKLCELYQDEKELERISEASYDYIENNYSEKNAWDVIKSDFR